LATGGGAPTVVRAKALTGAGIMAWCQSDFQRAIAFHAESLALYQALGDKHGIAESLTNLGVQALYQGNHEQAMSLLQEGLQCYRELGEKSATANTLVNLGEVARHLGDLAGAMARYEESLVLFRELGDMRWIAVSIHNLGLVAADRGDFARALALQRESLALFQELGDKQALPESLEKLADVFVAQQYPERAARLLGTAEALRVATHVPVPPVDQTDYERAVTAAHSQLDEATFAAAWAEGRAMTLEQAIDLALAVNDDPAMK
jgi:tetratricopeptide (TPR) repeat protein